MIFLLIDNDNIYNNRNNSRMHIGNHYWSPDFCKKIGCTAISTENAAGTFSRVVKERTDQSSPTSRKSETEHTETAGQD